MALTSLLSASLDFNLESTGNRHSFLGWYYHVQFTDIFNGDRYLAHQHWLILSEREILFKRTRKNVRVFSSTHSKAIKKMQTVASPHWPGGFTAGDVIIAWSHVFYTIFFYVWLITICWWKRQIYISFFNITDPLLHFIIFLHVWFRITRVKKKVCISIYGS